MMPLLMSMLGALSNQIDGANAFYPSPARFNRISNISYSVYYDRRPVSHCELSRSFCLASLESLFDQEKCRLRSKKEQSNTNELAPFLIKKNREESGPLARPSGETGKKFKQLNKAVGYSFFYSLTRFRHWFHFWRIVKQWIYDEMSENPDR